MLKNLKSLFVVEEEVKESSAKDTNTPAQKTSDVKTPDAKTPTNSPAGQNTSIGSSQINTKIMEKLLSVIETNNQEGYDYIEYKKSIQAMIKMPMDEKTRYQSAYAVASTMGASIPKITDSIAHYKKVLENEHNTFQEEIKTQLSAKVSNREQEIKALEKTMADKAAQIQKLTEEITAHQTTAKTLSEDILNDTAKITKTEKEFTFTYQDLISKIDTDLEKIKQYLS